MRTDAEIQKDILNQLKWEAFLNAAEIGVAVKDGVVTLSGQVDSYYKKIGAELAVRKIAGVKAVAEEIQVGVSPVYLRSDAEIAKAVTDALKWHTAVEEDKIKILVEKGVVTLSGEVDWNYQRQAVVDAIRNMAGITRVNNYVTVKPGVTSADIQQKISDALERHATIDSEKIRVELVGHKVILRGTVRSLAEKDDAELAAWSAPGITSVENRLTIAVREYSF
ncbi:BON domain-containing protein [Flavitalea sp. BT771]|uniref:BON domain-containing protein n=1 Tax=Flavitalea sp. BT771 TaxID=3063329 RepID=UPI0026E2C363|nr:BON domain-containing protein [Flavitalea sp. BT771]MDO6429519.1 BON domain-containing protein [Flavitalea sp. BT771]MDV6218353.1 BON domain-containing protein [Flavitalea sp. BT771]